MANIELDGTNKKIKVDSGDLTLDVPGDIILDADGADLVFADGGTNILKVTNSSSDVVFQPQVDAKDIIFKQYDGTTVATVEDNATFNIPASKLAIGGTAVTSTAAELNLLDGGTSVGSSITEADADGFIVNDGGTMKTIPATDLSTYIGGGITVAGQFRLTTDFTGDANPIASNWEEVDTFYSRIGSAVSESSGVFTMPSTGVYWIVYHTSVSYNGENNYHEAILQGSSDGFSSDTSILASKYSSSSDHGTTSYYGASCHAIYDVTNTSNNKIKCRVNVQNDSATTKGSSVNTQTSLTIFRIGDT